MCYTIALGFLFGGFIGYLNSVWQIFNEVFNGTKPFTIYFALSAFSMSCASLLNGMIVNYYKIHHICTFALLLIIIMSFAFIVCGDFKNLHNLFAMYIGYIIVILFCYGLLFSNLNNANLG